jgi:hypothetical protein
MKLSDWLQHSNVSRFGFARRTGFSDGSINQDHAGAYPGIIFRETAGAVTPNEFSP